MSSAILVINAGSSTIKFAVYGCAGSGPELLAGGTIDNSPAHHGVTVKTANGEVSRLPSAGVDPMAQFRWILQWTTTQFPALPLVAVGHRIVHGGSQFSSPVIINADIKTQLAALTPLAPLHQPHNLAGVDAIAAVDPGLPQVACFDTAFHHSMSSLETRFALPRALFDEGVRRYGFHGLSYDYIAGVLPDYAGARAEGRVIVAHLGSGASLCAMRALRSVATTMGFTALDGLPMAERCGAVDPGVLLYLMHDKGMDYENLSHLLYHQSGLLGVSGISGDVRTLEASADAAAKQALELFVYRISREIGALAAVLGGLDMLVFTGGIGENAVPIRKAVCEHSRWLGIEFDAQANQDGQACISTPTSPVAVYIIHTDENRVIATATAGLMLTR